MRIVALDYDKQDLCSIESELRIVFPDSQIFPVSTVREWDDFLSDEETRAEGISYAFIAVQLGNLCGIELADSISNIYPDCRIAFCGPDMDVKLHACAFHNVGYLFKPVKAADIERLLENAKPQKRKKRVVIRTFGNFDMFVDGRPVHFNSSKSKEAMAYLVDRRGSIVTTNELYTVLWEDDDYSSSSKNKVQHVKKDLRDTLRQYGLEEILISYRNQLALDFSNIECDYIEYMDFIEGRSSLVRSYNGEYMTQYSWGEETKGMLEEKSRSICFR